MTSTRENPLDWNRVIAYAPNGVIVVGISTCVAHPKSNFHEWRKANGVRFFWTQSAGSVIETLHRHLVEGESRSPAA
ncbi:MAG: hypothetical protein ACRDZ7_11030 [Acidimicrobiia bacterium]